MHLYPLRKSVAFFFVVNHTLTRPTMGPTLPVRLITPSVALEEEVQHLAFADARNLVGRGRSGREEEVQHLAFADAAAVVLGACLDVQEAFRDTRP